MKKISAISMSIVLILSIFSYASADNTPVKESDFNIVNKSNVQISAKSVENKGVTISDNIKADKSNALIVDSKSSIDIKKSLETEAYDILVVIDDTDKEKLHITWNAWTPTVTKWSFPELVICAFLKL